jgi:hypothetical protein
MLIAVLFVAGCHSRRPDFMTRVREDCSTGQQWACDLIDALKNPTSTADTSVGDSVKGNVEAVP